MRLIDTAGMRKKAKVEDKLEKLSVADARRAVDFAEVVVLLLDGTRGLEAQDLQDRRPCPAGGPRADRSRSTNGTWPKMPSSLFNGIKAALEEGLRQARGVPLLTVSGKTGKGIDQLLGAAFEVRETWSKRVSTGQLNRWFEEAVEKNPPPAPGGKRIKLRYITQVNTRPPSFVLFGTRVDQLPDSYLRYLVNGIRRELGFGAVPVRLAARASRNPFDESASLSPASTVMFGRASSTPCLPAGVEFARVTKGTMVDEAGGRARRLGEILAMRTELGASFVRILGYFREDGEKAVAGSRRRCTAATPPARPSRPHAEGRGAPVRRRAARRARRGDRAGRPPRASRARFFPDNILPQVARLRPLYQRTIGRSRPRPIRSSSAARTAAAARATRNSGGSSLA